MADSTTWLRLPVMILFMIVLYILVWVVGLVALVQFVIKLTTGETQPKIRALGHCLSLFTAETIAFVTFRSEEWPYPWAPWPCGDSGQGGEPQPEAESIPLPPPAEPEPAPRKRAPRKRKSTGRKSAAKSDSEAKPADSANPATGPDAPPDPE